MTDAMTGKQRILAALENREADRVPIFEMGINEASIVNLGRFFTDDLPPIKHVYDMTMEEQVRYLDLLGLILSDASRTSTARSTSSPTWASPSPSTDRSRGRGTSPRSRAWSRTPRISRCCIF